MARRSVLFAPGDSVEKVRKALDVDADVVVCDLEDAVAPPRKDDARATVHEVLSGPRSDVDCEVCVRVNPRSAGLDEDLDVLFGRGEPAALDGIVLPKVAGAGDVDELQELMAHYDAAPSVLALVESARGVLSAVDIAARPATDALIFGAEDFAIDVGAIRTAESREIDLARQRIVLAASAHEIDAIDTVYTALGDDAGLREDAQFGRQLGFDGKLAIHPKQLSAIHDAFTPADNDVAWARSVLSALEEMDEVDTGVFEVDGEMIDRPLIDRAEAILDRADRP